MRAPLFALLAQISLLATLMPLQAGVVETDLVTPGDGLLTYDTVNKREWLDLPETSEVELSIVMAQMVSGGRLEDFKFATLQDVSELAASAGVGWMAPWTLPGNPGHAALELINLLDWIVYGQGSIIGDMKITLGLISKGFINGEPQFDDTNFFVFSVYSGTPLLPGQINSPIFHQPTASGGVYIDGPAAFPGGPAIGIGNIGPFWLYRSAVPEPNSILLLVFGGGMLLGRVFRKTYSFREENFTTNQSNSRARNNAGLAMFPS